MSHLGALKSIIYPQSGEWVFFILKHFSHISKKVHKQYKVDKPHLIDPVRPISK
jgi:hypothetical protein